VLLDPPETSIIQQEKIVAVDKTDPPLINDKKDTKESIEKNKAVIEKEVKSSPKSLEKNKPSDFSAKSITVKSADTIYKIARENKIPGITTEQMVVGIFNLNELAFTNKNINGLEVGQKIVLPTKDDSKAMAEIKIQSAQWNKFSTKTAEAVAASSKIISPKSDALVTTETVVQSESISPTPRIKLTGDTLSIDKNSKEVVQKEINQIIDDKTALEKNIKDAEQKIALLEKELADAKKILAISNQALFELQEKSKHVNQTKDLTHKVPEVESKPDLNSLIAKPNDLDANKNEVTPPADTTFKSSISDGPIDEKASAQLASDKEVSSVSSSSGLFIFLGVLLAILIMLFVIRTKKQQEQKDLIDYINKDEDKPEVSPIKGESGIEEVDLSGIEINLSDKDQKPTHLD
jgi:pilus assembly protein FimV